MSTKSRSTKKIDAAQEAADSRFLDELTELAIKRRAELDAAQEAQRREEARAAREALRQAQLRKYIRNTFVPVCIAASICYLHGIDAVSYGVAKATVWIAGIYMIGNYIAYATRNRKRNWKGVQA